MEYLEEFMSKRIDEIRKISKQRASTWYTNDQFEIAQRHVKFTIERRYQFILSGIERYVQCNKARPLRILDAGCGDGVQLEGIIHISEVEVWGIDSNPIRTGRARRRFPAVKILCGDLLHMPFRERVFDIVLCSQVIEHIAQDDLVLEGLAKLLKPEGLMILGTPNEGCFMAQLRNYIFERRILNDTDHMNFYKEPIIRQKIEAAGFVIEEVMRENWFFPHQWVNQYLSNRHWGFHLMGWFNKIIPSQTAGYYFRCVR